MGGWKEGRESRVKDCLQQSKIDISVQFQLYTGRQEKRTLKVYLNHANNLAMEGSSITRSNIQDLVAYFEALLKILRLLVLGQFQVEGRCVGWSL